MSTRLACVGIILALATMKGKGKRRKRVWMKRWLKRRNSFTHEILLKELALSSPDDYKRFLRIDQSTFEELVNMVTPIICKENTQLRAAIPVSQRLSSTLRFLATGQSYEELKYTTAISAQCLGKIVMETCAAIICVLKDQIKVPQTEDEWREIAHSFEHEWNFPHCIGAIDGKHIQIKKPAGSGSYYYNYKGTFSVVLMAIVNANYEFTMVDVGTNGRVSDGGVFGKTTFCQMLKDKALHIPDPQTLPGTNYDMPYVLVGDDAFPLLDNIMKPYAQGNLTKSQQVFNYRLSRARRIVENTFGILSNRFRILQCAINVCPTKATTIVLACCYLHNYLRKKNPGDDVQEATTHGMASNSDASEGCFTVESHQLMPLEPLCVHDYPTSAKASREKFCHYFNSVGSVPWQDARIMN